MKKIILLFALASAVTPAAAVDWWKMPTICKPNSATCYTSMGSGFDEAEWDDIGNCRGKKLICPSAITGGANAPEALAKHEISDPSKIADYFDVSALDAAGECFGMRRTRSNGTSAQVGSSAWVNVYCAGALGSPDEVLPTGGIMLNPLDQPTCETLKADGYIGVLNGSCYGKPQYPPSDFFLECEGGNLLPSRIVILNGATEYRAEPGTPTPSLYPTTEQDAAMMFDQMANDAEERRQANSPI
ncbi:MAG: hypothetical protein LBL21_05045 [Rickettsiales bacterium]|jgi:hypothetical protein|nr:hypothetical protein [Rickettsiales bacterium]